ncbi:MAG: ABC transporter permease [Chloroflexota bacterium]
MSAYIIRRLIQAVPLLVGLSILAFSIMHMAPGGPMAVYAENPTITEADLKRIEHALGLDQPLHIQYVKWVSGIARGDWGYSYRTGKPVTELVMERIPNTLQLMVLAYGIAAILGIGVGIIGAVKRYSFFDYVATTGAMIALSIPTFWFGLMVIYLFSVELGWIPSGGMYTLGTVPTLVDRIHHIVAPAVVLGLVMVATWSRYTRNTMLEVLSQDYIRTARAKGLRERVVLLGHALRNALIPLITLLGLYIPHLFSGALVTETVFSWPGIGRLYLDSLNNRDYPVIMALLMVTAFLVLVSNLLADILYGVADPRIRHQ